MSKNDLIQVYCFDQEIGLLGFDETANISFFQYNPEYLASNKMKNLFPETGIIKRVHQKQIFRKFTSDTFRSLPPMIADSLPDMFGNIIFKEWLESSNKDFKKITVLEQLAYVANRGMGALEYRPEKNIPQGSTIVIDDIVEVLKKVLDVKKETSSEGLNHKSLLNVFKIGTSAGGARPKILISEHKVTGRIMPGDIDYSAEYDHYLVKLNLDEVPYNREIIEYSYYLLAIHLGISMTESKMIDGKHFATKRFDRVDGRKKHVLTTTGLTGWDFSDTTSVASSYENLFDLALFLKVPHSDMVQLYRRMIFNVIFSNTDDHFKNQSFLYDEKEDTWSIAPAYDITYSLNPMINYKKSFRALSINGKKADINFEDVKTIAEKFTIKGFKGIISEIENGIGYWQELATELEIPEKISSSISKDFVQLLGMGI